MARIALILAIVFGSNANAYGDPPPTGQGAPPEKQAESAQDKYDRAIALFVGVQDMAAAERGLRTVVDDPTATGDLRNRALFYLAATLGRQEKYAEALKVKEVWLAEFPNDKSRHYVLLFKGIYLDRLGEPEKARACWEQIVSEAPESDLADHARTHLDMPSEFGRTDSETPEDAPPLKSELPADAGRPGRYVVVPVDLSGDDGESRAFMEVARAVAKFHDGLLEPFDGRDFEKLFEALRRHNAQNVLFVIRPEALDVNFHRQILLLSPKIDDDIFPDFAFGYFTARDGAGLRKLWERTVATHRKGLSSRTWLDTAVTSSMKSTVYKDSVSPAAKAAGFSGDSIYFGQIEADPEVMQFVDSHLDDLEGAAVVEMTGCGDPQGIWLFDDGRNAQRDKHWPFDPSRVGQDPKGEMPRIGADRFAKLKLNRPVVWSGTCHCAATRRVFVEGDIISTFGRTDKATVYELKPSESLCLAMIDGGAVAFLAPIAANHGMSVSRESNFALAHGATLGETIKSTYDDVFVSARGAPRLALQEAGKPQRDDGNIMYGGGANRILIGDPALAPFKKSPNPDEIVEITKKPDGSLDVVLSWKEGFHPWAWDMFGSDRQRDWGIARRIPLDDLVPAGRSVRISATVRAEDDAGDTLPYFLVYAAPETFHGRRFLHLRANGPRKAIERKAVKAVFSVTME